MKTAYTDQYGVYPWAMLFVSFANLLVAYHGYSESDGIQLAVGIGSAFVFLFLGLKRFWEVRHARKVGRDPTIIRISESEQQ